jgi:TRAP-type C4-dicarboxylate transport system permease small subunit
MLATYQRLLAAIDRVFEIAIIIIMSTSSFDWADEVARLCFVWTIFLAIPLALRQGGHIVMELLVTRVSAQTRDRLYRSMSALSIVMMAFIAREGWKLTIDNWDETIPSIGLSGGLFFLVVAIGCAHTVLHLVNIAFVGEPRRAGIIE